MGPGRGPRHRSLVARPLELDELVLHHLTGLSDGDALLDGLAEPAVTALEAPALAASQRAVADELAAAVVAVDGQVLVRLDGSDADARTAVAAHLAGALGLDLLRVRDAAVPEPASPWRRAPSTASPCSATGSR